MKLGTVLHAVLNVPSTPDPSRRSHEPEYLPAVPGLEQHVPIRLNEYGAAKAIIPILAFPSIRHRLIFGAVVICVSF